MNLLGFLKLGLSVTDPVRIDEATETCIDNITNLEIHFDIINIVIKFSYRFVQTVSFEAPRVTIFKLE